MAAGGFFSRQAPAWLRQLECNFKGHRRGRRKSDRFLVLLQLVLELHMATPMAKYGPYLATSREK